MDALDFLAQDNYIIVNKTLIKEIGLENAIVLGALCGYQRYYGINEFYKEQEKMIEDTGLSEYSIRKAIKELKSMEYIKVNKRGMPAKIFYKINLQKFNILNSRDCENDTSCSCENEDVYINNNITNKENINNKNNIEENIKRIFTFWNAKDIIQHKFSADIESAIKKALSKYSLDDIEKAILHYSIALKSKYEYCDYKWGLVKFLTQKNTLADFLDDGTKWVNYLNWKNKQYNNQDEEVIERLGIGLYCR